MADPKGVVIVAELADGKVIGPTLECLALGRKLADDLGEGLFAVMLGTSLAEQAKELVAFGADRVYTVDDPLLKDYQTDAYVTVLAKVCKQVSPNILLMGHTMQARDLAPRLAFRLETGLAPDCVELRIDPSSKLLVQTRPVYGGNARATVVCPAARPQMATVRVKTASPLPRNTGRQGEVVHLEAGIDSSALKTRLVQRVKQESQGVRLEDASVIVTGGRGLGGPENFVHLEELARVLKGTVGATRAVCDSGWKPHALQIGLTGKTVAPDLYITVGVSGASQHMAGCSGAKVIVAVNKDPGANIFKEARYGVVGEWQQVLPSFIEMVKELVGS